MRTLPRGVALLALIASACQTPAILTTARTLPAGAADVSLSVNLTRLSTEEATEVDGSSIPATSFTYTSVLPELLLGYGVAEDFELGGHLALGSGLIELSGKYRFIHAGAFHAAVAPALGYRALGIVNGPVVTLPVLFTYALSPNVALSGGPLLAFASYDVPDDLDGGEDADIGGDTVYAGGALGVELRGGKLHIMPSVELQRSLSRTGDVADLPVVNLVFLSVTAGIGGAE